jgi:hypothetical protein
MLFSIFNKKLPDLSNEGFLSRGKPNAIDLLPNSWPNPPGTKDKAQELPPVPLILAKCCGPCKWLERLRVEPSQSECLKPAA